MRRLRVHAVARGLGRDLRYDLPDDQFIEVTGEHDAGVGEAGVVEHARSANAQVGKVAGVQANADGLVPFASQFLEDADGVRHAALERVDGVDEQQAVVGIDVGVGAEGAEFAHAQGHEELHHAVGVGSLRLEAHGCRKTHVRRVAGAADQGGACAGVGAPLLGRGADRTRAPACRGRCRPFARPWSR